MIALFIACALSGKFPSQNRSERGGRKALRSLYFRNLSHPRRGNGAHDGGHPTVSRAMTGLSAAWGNQSGDATTAPLMRRPLPSVWPQTRRLRDDENRLLAEFVARRRQIAVVVAVCRLRPAFAVLLMCGVNCLRGDKHRLSPVVGIYSDFLVVLFWLYTVRC
ncbi:MULTISPECIES: hypothetical protein [unclassified Ensifer]|uniref:hypothetical protein n=1 Tax=unclassified Ensifer TaxID=2633371 RepID=UPI001111B6A4|nr:MULTISPECIES: hypothetical protein [unclassified Ensifer]